MISPTMRRALEIFEDGRRDAHYFGDQFWPSGRVMMARFAPGTRNHDMALATIQQMLDADLLQPHWKQKDHYELTTKGKALLKERQAHDESLDSQQQLPPIPKPWKLRN